MTCFYMYAVEKENKVKWWMCAGKKKLFTYKLFKNTHTEAHKLLPVLSLEAASVCVFIQAPDYWPI